MLDIKFIRGNFSAVEEMLKNRGYVLDLSRFDALDAKRREKVTALEELRHRRNRVSEEIALKKKSVIT
jgi:seryl-tRNA synthetase